MKTSVRLKRSRVVYTVDGGSARVPAVGVRDDDARQSEGRLFREPVGARPSVGSSHYAPAMPVPPDSAPSSPTFSEAWRRWLDYRCCGVRPLRLSTIADYESSWRCHLEPTLGPVPLPEIDGANIVQLVVALSAKGVRPTRLYKVLAPVRACLRWHYPIGLYGRDPTYWFDAPRPSSARRRILTIEQVERLIAAMPTHHRPFVTFAAYTGARLGELRDHLGRRGLRAPHRVDRQDLLRQASPALD